MALNIKIEVKKVKMMTTNSIDSANQQKNLTIFKQLLTLVLSSCIAVVVLIFIVWLYFTSKSEVTSNVAEEFKKIEVITKELIGLKKKELKLLAKNMSSSAVLRSSLQTAHKETIEDALDGIVKKYGLAFALVVQKKEILFRDTDSQNKNLKKIVAGNILGTTKMTLRKFEGAKLLLGESISVKDLKSWSEITNSQYLVYNKSQEIDINTEVLKDPSFHKESLSQILELPGEKDSGTYFLQTFPLMKKTLYMTSTLPKSRFWGPFIKKRNDLIILGLVAILIGIIMSVIVSVVFSKHMLKNTFSNVQKDELVDDLIKEIELVKLELSKG
jgi:hypothetical protein